MSKLTIQTENRIIPVEKDLYGIFFEDINRSGDGGLYPEMLRNRTFEDSIPPVDCDLCNNGYSLVTKTGWNDEFNHGEGLSRWIRENETPFTPIPAWYSKNAHITLSDTGTLNEQRQVCLHVDFLPGGYIVNTGYHGIAVEKKKSYKLLMFVKTYNLEKLEVLISENDECCARSQIRLDATNNTDYQLIETEIRAVSDTSEAEFRIISCDGGEVSIGYISLMPEETYKGHGLRIDLAEKLEALHPRFLRFPGGCVVEGISPSTMMLFKNTVGPVWERPGHQLMWHYRSTNGLGFHEFLQLCEDLDMEPIYVFNCGITCQARKPMFLTGEKLQDVLKDVLDAIEYAMAPIETKWGSMRAKMGHPDPFKLNYLEIGNENWGPEYESRYKLFHKAISEKYPHMQFIANEHIEKEGLMVDIVDEHYYNTAECFSENTHHFDSYDRKGPKIFLGELSVVRGYVAQLYGALGEGAFLIGAEHNQDIVKFISYAPLLENMSYSAWFPNLIRFDNRASFCIPAYYTWKLFGQNRGDFVVASQIETNKSPRIVKGMASLLSREKIIYKNARWNDTAAEISHTLMGSTVVEESQSIIVPPELQEQMEKNWMWQVDVEKSFVVFGEENETIGKFDIEIYYETGIDITIGLFSSRIAKEVFVLDETKPIDDWNAEKVRPLHWRIKDGTSIVCDFNFGQKKNLTGECKVVLKKNEFNRFTYTFDGSEVQLYINTELIQTFHIPVFNSLATIVTDTENDIIIKAVNFAMEKDVIDIHLDCEVKNEYTAYLLTGEQTEENTLEQPERLCDKMVKLTGADKYFTYEAPPFSVNVLILQKTQSKEI